MPEFIMPVDDTNPRWINAPQFVKGYIEAMFFADTSEPDLETARFEDIDDANYAAIAFDCARWQRRNASLLQAACALDDYDRERAGSDYWFTRCGHGVGYWCREQLPDELGKALSDAAAAAGEAYIYRGDDGKIYYDSTTRDVDTPV